MAVFAARIRAFIPAVLVAIILVATALQVLFVSCNAQAPAPAPSYCDSSSGLLCGSACQHPLLFSEEDWVLSFYSREHCPVVGPLAPGSYSYATVCGNLTDCFHCFNLPNGLNVQSAVVTSRLFPDPATLRFSFYNTLDCPNGT